MKITLIRHGQTRANIKRLYCGVTDLPLIQIGIDELRAKNYVASLSAVFVTSGLKRAAQSLEILYGKEPDVVLDNFNEMNFGDFEMMHYDQMRTDPEYIRFITGDASVACPNGESRAVFTERVRRGYNELLAIGAENVVVVTHGGVIATIMDWLFPNKKNFYEWQPACGEGYVLESEDKKTWNWSML